MESVRELYCSIWQKILNCFSTQVESAHRVLLPINMAVQWSTSLSVLHRQTYGPLGLVPEVIFSRLFTPFYFLDFSSFIFMGLWSQGKADQTHDLM